MVSSSQFDIIEHKCDNGLSVLLLPAETAPVVCVSVWYRAGSRHDAEGKSGTAHLLEHMMFKGTDRYAKGAYDSVLHALGASNNASTWLDRTNYYILIGSDRYETALELEADRMRGILLREEDLKDERPVVLNELDRNADDPGCTLVDRVLATAYSQHPYRRPVIGARADVENITRTDLLTYYDQYYQPDNAFLVIVGQFVPEEMIEAIERQFGSLPSGVSRSAPDSLIEPRQSEERRFEISRSGQQDLLGIAYHAPQRSDYDAYAMDILAQVLGHGRTSRLYKGLVESGLAVHASAENQSMPADPFLFLLDIELADGVEAERALTAVDREISGLFTQPVSERELKRALKRARVDFIMRRDSVSALAFLLGEFEISTGWRYLETYQDNLSRVTPAQVSAAAERYLTSHSRTVGYLRSQTGSQETQA